MAKSLITVVDDLAEGVYMASGYLVPESAGFSATGYLDKEPLDWSEAYLLSFTADNQTADSFDAIRVIVSFDIPMTFNYGDGLAGEPNPRPDQISFVWWVGVPASGKVGLSNIHVTPNDPTKVPTIEGITVEGIKTS